MKIETVVKAAYAFVFKKPQTIRDCETATKVWLAIALVIEVAAGSCLAVSVISDSVLWWGVAGYLCAFSILSLAIALMARLKKRILELEQKGES